MDISGGQKTECNPLLNEAIRALWSPAGRRIRKMGNFKSPLSLGQSAQSRNLSGATPRGARLHGVGVTCAVREDDRPAGRQRQPTRAPGACTHRSAAGCPAGHRIRKMWNLESPPSLGKSAQSRNLSVARPRGAGLHRVGVTCAVREDDRPAGRQSRSTRAPGACAHQSAAG